jgi:type VI secretion system Hcp family effector
MYLNKLSVPSILLLAASVLLPALPARTQSLGVMTVTSPNHRGNEITSRVTQVNQGSRNANDRFKTVVIVKEIDSASPKLVEAQATNEPLNVIIKIDSPKNGKDVETLDLQDATIVRLCGTRQGAKTSEKIEFRYNKIEVTNHDGSKSNVDSWNVIRARALP